MTALWISAPAVDIDLRDTSPMPVENDPNRHPPLCEVENIGESDSGDEWYAHSLC